MPHVEDKIFSQSLVKILEQHTVASTFVASKGVIKNLILVA